jgi:hypothetical protein
MQDQRRRRPRQGQRAVADKLARIWRTDGPRDPRGTTQPAIYTLALNVLIPDQEFTYHQVKKNPWKYMGMLHDPKIDRRREKLLLWFHREFWRLRPLDDAEDTYGQMAPWIKQVVTYLLANRVDLNTTTWEQVTAPLRAESARRMAAIPVTMKVDGDLAWRTTKDIKLIMEIGRRLDHCYDQVRYAREYFLEDKQTHVLFDGISPVAAITIDGGSVTEFRGHNNEVAPDGYLDEAAKLIEALVPNAGSDIEAWGEAHDAAPDELQDPSFPDSARELLEEGVQEIEALGVYSSTHDLSFSASLSGTDDGLRIEHSAEIEIDEGVITDMARSFMRKWQHDIGNATTEHTRGKVDGWSPVLEGFDGELDEDALAAGTLRFGTAAEFALDFYRRRLPAGHADWDANKDADGWDPITAIVNEIPCTPELNDNFLPPAGSVSVSGTTVSIEFSSSDINDQNNGDNDWDTAAEGAKSNAVDNCEQVAQWVHDDLDGELRESVGEFLLDMLYDEATTLYMEHFKMGQPNRGRRSRRRGRGRKQKSPVETWLKAAAARLKQGFTVADTVGNRALLHTLHEAEKKRTGQQGIRVRPDVKRGRRVIYVKR